jgi:tripartite-type tricarboxylate transporter receptor subunit TctC
MSNPTPFQASRRQLLRGVATLGLGALVIDARAQAGDYPQRPITIVVGFPPGTSTDTVTRLIADRMGRKLGQPIIVENRTGQGGAIGAAYVSRAAPDGYTLVMSGTVPMVISPILDRQTTYDALRDFTSVGMATYGAYLMVAGPKLKVDLLADLVSQAKAKPGAITYATTGIGTTSHLLMSMFASQAGIRMTHVPYRGSVQATTDLLGGIVDIMIDPVFTMAPFVNAGKLKPLAVSSARRQPSMPKVPTIAESGFAGFEGGAWIGILGPAGVSQPVVAKLNDALQVALADPAIREMADRQGFETRPGTPEGLQEQLRSDKAKWPEAVRLSGAVAE